MNHWQSPKLPDSATLLTKSKDDKIDDQQELLSLVTRRTNNYVIITDKNGFIEWVNESFERFSGYKLEEIKGLKPKSFLHGPETDVETTKLISRRLRQEKSFSCEIVNYTKKGEKYWVHINCQPLKNKEGEIIRLFALMVNITEQKWLIENLIQARQKAEESDRLKSAFLANMSHEIRTPMNAIMGFSELLGRPNMPMNKREEFAHLIRQRSKDLLSIVNDILDISKIEAGQMMSVPAYGHVQELLNELLKNITAEVDHLHNKSIEVKIHNELKGAENIVLADFGRLRQVFTNLLNNALKFTQSGSIEFGCRLLDRNTFLFSVRDTGIGIDSSSHEIIFKPFHQASDATHQHYGGTGLGLAITKGLLNLWNGKIWVESEPGNGATFFFTMPYLPQNNTFPVDQTRPEHADWKDVKMVLIEPDFYSASYIKEILADTSCELTHVESGIKALEVIHHIRPSVVLIDLGLPDISGMKIIEQVKKIHPEIIMVPITALATSDHKTKAMALGCRAFLTKPMSEKRFLRTLNPIISQIRNYRTHGLPY